MYGKLGERAKRKRNQTNTVHRLNIAKASEAGEPEIARWQETENRAGGGRGIRASKWV